MKLIVGLGNPGDNFSLTKHNFGFWIIDKLVEQRSLKYKAGKGEYIYVQHDQYILVKPTTYVNNSGIAIKQILNNYDSLTINDIIVIYDDIDIDLGKMKFRAQGTDGGHNGMKSIIYHLGTDYFDRLKIGIATNMKMRPSEDYVLKSFPPKYNNLVAEVIENATLGISCYLEKGMSKAMNNFN